jgi:hypothetical protein
MLAFGLRVLESDYEMSITRLLQARRFGSPFQRFDEDAELERYGLAYDTCILYVDAHCDAVEGMGFDASEFRRQRAALSEGVST